MDPFIAFLIFAVLVALETLAHQFALPAFFRFGLPIFSARRPFSGHLSADIIASSLSNQIQPSRGFPTMHFPVLSQREIAVQERLFENRSRGRFLPVMHSILRLHPDQGQLTLTGYLNLYALAAVAYIIYRGSDDRSFIPIGALILGLLLLSYYLQAGLNQRILDAASQNDTNPSL